MFFKVKVLIFSKNTFYYLFKELDYYCTCSPLKDLNTLYNSNLGLSATFYSMIAENDSKYYLKDYPSSWYSLFSSDFFCFFKVGLFWRTLY